jgi:uncharacterized protein (TIGR00255 family)
MVQSMTGYGAFTISSDDYKVTVEVKSLNSKFLEINMKLPRAYMRYEVQLRNYLTQQLVRGKINVALSTEIMNPQKHRLDINRRLLKAYHRELDTIRTDLGLEKEPDLQFLLTLPDVIASSEDVGDPEEYSLIQVALQNASKDLQDSRTQEGVAIEQDFKVRLEMIRRKCKQVEDMAPGRVRGIRDKMLATLHELSDNLNVDANRFEQELIYFIEKLDITEEVVRLNKHLEYFERVLEDSVSQGKKLSFIAQEMGREINTIGSKANDADIQVFVVEMKEELEKIKEQLNNVL